MPKFHKMGRPDPSEEYYMFWCPGCDYAHGVRVAGSVEPVWGWNKSLEAPTITPSLLVNGHGDGVRCHSWIVDGNIQFLTDSQHAKAGQTVPLPNWEDIFPED